VHVGEEGAKPRVEWGSKEKFNPPRGYSWEADEEEFVYTADRTFDRLPEEMEKCPDTIEIVERFVKYLAVDPDNKGRKSFTFGVHGIRIMTGDFKGDVVPEGIHQDGYAYVGIGCVDRENVSGGELDVYLAGEGGSMPPPGSDPFFHCALAPGSMVFIDDRSVWHDAKSIAPVDETKPAFVDFIVCLFDPGEQR